jgi:hypothetical protein
MTHRAQALVATANELVAHGMGILAADESNGTMSKRLGAPARSRRRRPAGGFESCCSPLHRSESLALTQLLVLYQLVKRTWCTRRLTGRSGEQPRRWFAADFAT